MAKNSHVDISVVSLESESVYILARNILDHMIIFLCAENNTFVLVQHHNVCILFDLCISISYKI